MAESQSDAMFPGFAGGFPWGRFPPIPLLAQNPNLPQREASPSRSAGSKRQSEMSTVANADINDTLANLHNSIFVEPRNRAQPFKLVPNWKAILEAHARLSEDKNISKAAKNVLLNKPDSGPKGMMPLATGCLVFQMEIPEKGKIKVITMCCMVCFCNQQHAYA